MKFLYKTQTRFMFHSHIRIKLPDSYPDAIFDQLFGVLENIDRKYNSYREGSYIDTINKYAGRYIEVDDELLNILKLTFRFSDYFEGKYDITVMPLIRLWGFYKNESLPLPTIEEINGKKKLVNYRDIEILGNHVCVAPYQEIITGSFLKSYAVDRLVEKMKSMGITDAIINAGGSTIAAINNDMHPYWKVNVRMPETGELLWTIPLSNQCLSTSAQSTAFVDINGKKYGHILNPLTGYPSENKQVGILSDTCMVGDILSTGLMNETPEEFTRKLEHLSADYNIHGYLIDKNNIIDYKYMQPLLHTDHAVCTRDKASVQTDDTECVQRSCAVCVTNQATVA